MPADSECPESVQAAYSLHKKQWLSWHFRLSELKTVTISVFNFVEEVAESFQKARVELSKEALTESLIQFHV